MTPLVIIGAGGHGSEVACYVRELEQLGKVRLLGFIDDGKTPGPAFGSEVLGPMTKLAELANEHGELSYITAFGSNALRARVVNAVRAMNITGLKAASIVSPAVWEGRSIQLGEGTCVAAGCILTSNVKIGTHCIVNMKASIAHDCEIGDFCNINPGATVCGSVQLGEGCYIGAGATIIEKRKIGAWTIVGAGAVVTQDLPEGVTAVGVPARIIKRQGVPGGQ